MFAGSLLSRAATGTLPHRLKCARVFSGAFATVMLLYILAPGAFAQDHWPAGTVGRLEGYEISVEGAAYPVSVQGATMLFVASGGVVTVHSGSARLTLANGGFVDISGPAKFTLLESGGSYTLALNFGRIRLRLTDATPVRVFTPFLIASPIQISGQPRDFTIGLDLNDMMCVYAAEGAGRLEPQFGGDSVVVPEAGEFSLPGERLPPVGARDGSCRTAPFEAPTAQRNRPPSPESLSLSKSANATPPAPAPKPAPAPPPAQPAEANKGFDLPANANRTPPTVPSVSNSTAEPPPVERQPAWTVTMPALSFSAGSPQPPSDNKAQYAQITDTQVIRDWVFMGHVGEKPAKDVKAASDAKPAAAAAPVADDQKKKVGFWGKLRHFFGGQQQPAPAPPVNGANPGV